MTAAIFDADAISLRLRQFRGEASNETGISGPWSLSELYGTNGQ